MYNRILIPLDGSKLAEEVLPYAKFLARALQLPMDLLHANDPEIAAPSAHTVQGADYLKAVAATLPASLAVNCSVENGRAAEVIVDNASRDPSTLITMATHGRSGGQRWLLGSVAQKVLQAAINPLLLIRPKRRDPSERRSAAAHPYTSFGWFSLGREDLSPRRLPCQLPETRSRSDPNLHSSNDGLFYGNRAFAPGHWRNASKN